MLFRPTTFKSRVKELYESKPSEELLMKGLRFSTFVAKHVYS